jgi:hypothetical protein
LPGHSNGRIELIDVSYNNHTSIPATNQPHYSEDTTPTALQPSQHAGGQQQSRTLLLTKWIEKVSQPGRLATIWEKSLHNGPRIVNDRSVFARRSPVYNELVPLSPVRVYKIDFFGIIDIPTTSSATVTSNG